MIDTRSILRESLDLLKPRLHAYLLTELRAAYGECLPTREPRIRSEAQPDVQALLSILLDHWNNVFAKKLRPAERALAHELKAARNLWAHEQPVSFDQAYRALDSVQLLLGPLGAYDVIPVLERKKAEMRRLQVLQEERPATGIGESAAAGCQAHHPARAQGAARDGAIPASTRSQTAARQSPHKWREGDDLVALYLQRYGADHLPFTITDIARMLGIKEGTLRMRIGNFKALAGEGGLGNWAKQSERVFEAYRTVNEADLRQSVLYHVASLSSSKAEHSRAL